MPGQTKTKILFFFLAVLLLLPLVTKSQVLDTGPDKLLQEYFFPISTFEMFGQPVQKRGIECDGFKLPNDVDYTNCPELPDFVQTAADIRESDDASGVLFNRIGDLMYRFAVAEQDLYVFNLGAINQTDNFSKLTRQQMDYIFSTPVDYPSYKINADKNLWIAEYGNAYGDATGYISGDKRYELFRSMIFSVYVDGEDPEKDLKGFVVLKNSSADYSQGQVQIGNLTPGEHTIYLHFLSDYYFDFYADWNNGFCVGGGDRDGQSCEKIQANDCYSTTVASCLSGKCNGGWFQYSACTSDFDCPMSIGECATTLPSFLGEFSSVDLNFDRILDTNPIVAQVAIDKSVPVEDVIGVRIYSNNSHKDPKTWYTDNVFNASSNVQEVKVDGYKAIRDDRTVYASAANIVDGVFKTHIYVIAYNEGAATTTKNIFDQMLTNWVFNTNILGEPTKDKLRRDTIRLADVYYMQGLIDAYYLKNNKYPILDAGSFVKNHSISTWPSWQATLGNELGGGLPIDPFNIMASEKRPPYDCNSFTEQDKCKNICTRDSSGNPLTGCPQNQQCVGSDYCSICPPGYDATNCWDNVNLNFALGVHSGCPGERSLNGSFNLETNDPTTPEVENMCQYEGAFVYQYTSVNKGQGYLLNYRLEYKEAACNPGQCYFDNKDGNPDNDCYAPGGCLAGCIDNNSDGLIDDTECPLAQYRNWYCYAGTWQQSCNDGFIQAQCGETCDPKIPLNQEGRTWCDITYDDQDWYSEGSISGTCNAQCVLKAVGDLDYTPQAYSTNPAELSCGGFCGDKFVQSLYEECDEGPNGGILADSNAGKTQQYQYMCAGVQGVKPMTVNAKECATLATWDDYSIPYPSCTSLTADPTELASIFKDTGVVSQGGFRASYDFNVAATGPYTFSIETANWDDDLTKLSNEQIDYLFFLKAKGVSTGLITSETLYNLTVDGGLQIEDYGAVTSYDVQKYNLVRSLIYSVYLGDDSNPANRKGFIIVPAANQNQKQEGKINLGVLSAGPQTVTLHFVGDHFYLPLASVNDPQKPDFSNVDLGETQNNELDVNPIIYSATLFSPELGVSSCKTFGGFCGDGQVQAEFGEQCDPKNYKTPLPAETVAEVDGQHQTYICGTKKDDTRCQYLYNNENDRSGYCGDGIAQYAFGETCDDRVGQSCSADSDCGKTGICVSGLCTSPNCSTICQGTKCGNGVVETPNGDGVNENCDWGQGPDYDPLCDNDCQHYKIGSACLSDQYTATCDPQTNYLTCKQCSAGLTCSIREFGDTETVCLGTRGSYGCMKNNDCAFGYYCNLSSVQCEPEISTYLKNHPEIQNTQAVPIPDVHIANCPLLEVVETMYITDKCTGLNWNFSDRMDKKAWAYSEAQNACSGDTRLPTITELYSLVRQTNQYTKPDFYADKAKLKLCPISCEYAPQEEDLCSDCIDDNYLYWSSTCAEESGGQCQKALAINFKYGSIEEYPVNEDTKLKVRCLKNTQCNNGKLEPGEACEFFWNAGQLVEQDINVSCSDYIYDGGKVHCDPVTCQYRFDNCYLNSVATKTCQQICKERKNLDCLSSGSNVATDVYNINPANLSVVATVADDGQVVDKNVNGDCELQNRASCIYPFVNRIGDNCLNTETQAPAPLASEYAYCNCEEK